VQTVNEFYKSIFGCKVYKISLDAGCTCPNRDGTLGRGGCLFCGSRGSGDFVADKNLSVTEQVAAARKLVDPKSPASLKYIAYFQNFTNTYGDLEVLAAKWREALACENVVGLALGTRPDCISQECLAVLAAFVSQGFFVQLELGFQTACEETAEFFHRGYKNEAYFDAVKRIHKAAPGVHVVTHVMFGLPCGDVPESSEQMMDSVRAAVAAGSDGIKIVNLYILKGSAFEKLYRQGRLRLLEYKEYLGLVSRALQLLPKRMVVHRLAGDPDHKNLVAPAWCSDKKRILNDLNKLLQN
jgi:radical SAM protein (TIGR01212 family)